jgi:hypothetical protein
MMSAKNTRRKTTKSKSREGKVALKNLSGATLEDMIAELERRGLQAAIVTAPATEPDAPATEPDATAEASDSRYVSGSKPLDDLSVHLNADMKSEVAVPIAFLLGGAAWALQNVPIGGLLRPKQAKAYEEVWGLLSKFRPALYKLYPHHEETFEFLEAEVLEQFKKCKRLAKAYVDSRSAGDADCDRLGEELFFESVLFGHSFFKLEDTFSDPPERDDKECLKKLASVMGRTWKRDMHLVAMLCQMVGNGLASNSARRASLDHFYNTVTQDN